MLPSACSSLFPPMRIAAKLPERSSGISASLSLASASTSSLRSNVLPQNAQVTSTLAGSNNAAGSPR